MRVPLQTPSRGGGGRRAGPGVHTGPQWLGPGHRSLSAHLPGLHLPSEVPSEHSQLSL